MQMYHMHSFGGVVAVGTVVVVVGDVVGDAVGDAVGNAVVACGCVTFFGTPVRVILNKNHEPTHYFLHNMACYIPATCMSYCL